MAAQTSQEEQKRRRRKRLLKGLLLGGAAVGIPALANAVIARRIRRLPAAGWGTAHRYAWRYGEIRFQLLGEGDPILLLHSFGPGYSGEEWRQAAQFLAERHTVYVPDLIGWGRSEKPQIDFDGELYMRLILDFLEDVVRRRATVVGAGLSAAYAVQVAADRPELVRALGLVVPAGIDVNEDEPDVKDALVYRLLRLPVLGTSALNLYTSRAGLGHYLRREAYRAPERVDAAAIDQLYRFSHQPGAHGALAAYLSGYSNHRARRALQRLESPPWLAWGRHANSPPVESADLWLHHQPSAELEVFEDSGNLPHFEQADALCRKLESFLSALAA
jgi:pimeloyl-ACP methyl ester carboxylesterase